MKVWLIGSKGMLAQAVARALDAAQTAYVGTDAEVDITDATRVHAFAADTQITHLINCAAYTNVDACETHEALATQVNGVGPANLGSTAARLGATALHISTDYVFDGSATAPYTEDAPTAPMSAYGRSKLVGEQGFLRAMATADPSAAGYVVRTAWLFGRGGKNFVSTMLRLMQERDALGVVADQVGRPTYCDDLAAAIVQLCGAVPGRRAAAGGVYHFANTGETSWHGFAEAILHAGRAAGIALRCQDVRPLSTAEYPLPARRPAYSVLSTDKITRALGAPPRPWQTCLGDYMGHWTQGTG